MDSAEKMIEYILRPDAKDGVLEKIGFDLANALYDDPNAAEKLSTVLDSKNNRAIEAISYPIYETLYADLRLLDKLKDAYLDGCSAIRGNLADYLSEWSPLEKEEKLRLARILSRDKNQKFASYINQYLEGQSAEPHRQPSSRVVAAHFGTDEEA